MVTSTKELKRFEKRMNEIFIKIKINGEKKEV
jgi:hypothetical protein